MNYEGKLYGKIGRKTFDTGKTSHDWDTLERDLGEARCEAEKWRNNWAKAQPMSKILTTTLPWANHS